MYCVGDLGNHFSFISTQCASHLCVRITDVITTGVTDLFRSISIVLQYHHLTPSALKRFSADGRRSKLETMVEVPEVLDFTKYASKETGRSMFSAWCPSMMITCEIMLWG